VCSSPPFHSPAYFDAQITSYSRYHFMFPALRTHVDFDSRSILVLLACTVSRPSIATCLGCRSQTRAFGSFSTALKRCYRALAQSAFCIVCAWSRPSSFSWSILQSCPCLMSRLPISMLSTGHSLQAPARRIREQATQRPRRKPLTPECFSRRGCTRAPREARAS